MKRKARRGPGVNLLIVAIGGPVAIAAVLATKGAMPAGAGIAGPPVLIVLVGVAGFAAFMWRGGDFVEKAIALLMVVFTLASAMGALPL